ncbi:MAG: c-type cytochrome [Planctomycetaceae bacterium]|nr:c-type cytochrome [Planctomycetaceae bacterium]
MSNLDWRAKDSITPPTTSFVANQERDEPETLRLPGTLQADSEYWLRCWVKVHENFFTPHDRNLFEESVGVHVTGFVGAHELWINGQKIGVAGSFPPLYQPADSGLIRHKVPAGTLRPGEWNEVAFRVYQSGPNDGFDSAAPFIMNYFYECVFAGSWELIRDGNFQPGPALPQPPSYAAFHEFRDSQEVLGRAEQVPGPRLPPHQSAAAMETRGDVRFDLLLSEPEIAQPFHFSFDQRGRLWVAQCRQYPYPAGLKMLSRDRYYRSHYDRVPPAPPNHDPGADLISIHEDTDGDGRFDLHKTFVSGLNLANAVVKGQGGVWIMHTPYLLFYPDANHDDIPDGPPEVHLAGFGFEDTHAMANGLVWGPDGWLYGCQGSSTSCRVTRPNIDPPTASGVYFEGCMVWRYHPRTRAFEIFAEGGGNTFGLEFDATGRLYSGHNGADTRGWHFVQGGFYLMQHADPGKFGPPRNPYAFGDLPMMATSTPVVRFSHFGAFAEGSALPSELRGQLVVLDPLHSELIAVDRKIRGATFQTSDLGVVVKSRDEAFRPVYIANAPDGAIYVADMYEYYIAHGQHYQNQIDTTTGRLYRLAGSGMTLQSEFDAGRCTSEQLIKWLDHPNKWHRFAASRELGLRADSATAARLNESFQQMTEIGALHALWALHQMQQVDPQTYLSALNHRSADVRMWAVRLIGDRYGVHRNLGLPPVGLSDVEVPPVPQSLLASLQHLAASDNSPEVRCQVAATARRLPLEDGLALLHKLLHRDEDADDPYIPLMCWWILEAHLPTEVDRVMDFFAERELWSRRMVRVHVLPRLTRRLAVEGLRVDLLRVAELLRRGSSPEDVAAVMQGFEAAYQGRAMTALPDELLAVLDSVGGGSLVFRMRQGQSEAFATALAIINDVNRDLRQRLALLRGLGELNYPASVEPLLAIIGSEQSPELQRAAFVALAKYDRTEIAEKTLEVLAKLDAESRASGIALMMSRPTWTRHLIQQLQSGSIPTSWLSSHVVDQLQTSPDEEVRVVAAKLFPKMLPSTPDLQARLGEIENVLKEAAGNPYAGEKIYMERCAACHKLFFKGGNLGPDLTSYQRDNLGTMLVSIVNPSAEIREGFELLRALTVDGRIVQGFQVQRDAQVLVLRGPDGQDVSLATDDIEQLEPAGRSLMPDGLLNDLEPNQIRDLFAYLRISQPFTN